MRFPKQYGARRRAEALPRASPCAACGDALPAPCGAQFTNVGKDFKGTLDYILYTTDSLAPVATLELPDDAEVRLCPFSSPSPLRIGKVSASVSLIISGFRRSDAAAAALPPPRTCSRSSQQGQGALRCVWERKASARAGSRLRALGTLP